MTSVSDIRVIDKLTVEISLRDPWPGFPVVLSDEPGMIPSPTAMKQACPADKNAAPKDCSFNLKPVGAGPFVIDDFKPKDSITMKRNPSYWDGPVYLDGLKFVSFGDGGGDRTIGFLKGGNVDVAFLRDAVAVASAKADGYAGYSQIVHSGQVEFMNNGTTVTCSKGQPAVCAGRADGPYTPPTATSDARVREAIAAAIDTKQLDQRVTGGRGLPGSEMFQKSFRYYPNVPGPAYDVAKAKQLVQAAKDGGWDGKVRYLCNSSAPAVQRALGIQAMLQAAGMTVEIQNSFDINAQQQRFIAGDFDINCGGMNMTDHSDRNPARSLANNLASAGNRIGYKSTEMDAALDALRAAATDAEKTAAYKRISDIYVRDVPMLVTAAVEEYVAWSGKVHDVYGTTATRVEFTKAWLSN
jgi:peptide/nickel transport system substrate-binding protein